MMSTARSRSLKQCKPPPDLTVSEWADEYRRLSSESSSEPGRWKTSRAPYQKGILDAISDAAVHTVVVMSSAQVGKTEIILNAIGYYSDQDPSPILMIQPTLEMAETFSKDRLAPMVRDTPVLKEIYPDAKTRGGGNTMLHKKFTGGHITMAGANSPASLASRPVRIVLFDEVDRYPASAGGEGDPVALGTKRTTTFWNRKRIITSTPTLEAHSRVSLAYDESDQCRYHLNCPHCGEAHHLEFKNLQWSKDDDGKHLDDVHMVCPECSCIIEEKDKKSMLANGEWVAGAEFTGTAGFHLNELYSPWKTWLEIRNDFLTARKSPETLKTFVNTSLGEVWREDEDTVDWQDIAARREPYGKKLPEKALVLTAAVDVQDDRLEYEIMAWGEGDESWGVKYDALTGDPGQPKLWEKLEDVLSMTFQRDDDVQLHIPIMTIDSGGHYTDQVYNFARKHKGRAYAIKGMAGAGRPISGRPSKSNKGKIHLYTVGTDTAKELLMFSMLRTTKTGASYCHFPADPEAGYDDRYFEMLTNEKCITKHKAGVPYRAWVAKGRNEALDCRVYNMAAKSILNPNYERIKQNQEPKEPEKKVSHTQRTRPKNRKSKSKNFATSW